MSDPKLERIVSERALGADYLTTEGLSRQTGQSRMWFAMMAAKELLDNHLEAPEGMTPPVRPRVRMEVERSGGMLRVTVHDLNGPGLSPEVLERTLDFNVLVSDKAAYVAATRGQQGHGLKLVYGIPWALAGQDAQPVVLATQGLRHTIAVSIAPAGNVAVKHGTEETGPTSGMKSTFCVPADGQRFDARDLIDGYHLLNPHADLYLVEGGAEFVLEHTVDFPSQWRKPLPTDPTSTHLYDESRFKRLIFSHKTAPDRGRQKSFGQFIGEFRGLSGRKKIRAVLAQVPTIKRVSDFEQHPEMIVPTLQAMQAHSTPPKPGTLGAIGQEHLRSRLDALCGIKPERSWYKPAEGMVGGNPFRLEVLVAEVERNGVLWTGLNYSPTLGDPFAEILFAWQDQSGKTERAYGLYDLLKHFHSAADHFLTGLSGQIVVVVHLIYPALDFGDRTKSTLASLPEKITQPLCGAVRSACKQLHDEARRRERRAVVEDRAADRWATAVVRQKRMSLKDAVYCVLPEAYWKASGRSAGKEFSPNGNQVQYAVRELILTPKLLAETLPAQTIARIEDAGFTPERLANSREHITKHLIRDFIYEHRVDVAKDWDVASDERGHAVEPHTGRIIGLGTLAVREYVRGWTNGDHPGVPDVAQLFASAMLIPTVGPRHRFSMAVLLGKEGFLEQIFQAGLHEKYDAMFKTTKGMNVTAVRQLIEGLSAQGIPTLVVDDFDLWGWENAYTLMHGTKRYEYKAPPNVVHAGLLWDHVKTLELIGEPVTYGRRKKDKEKDEDDLVRTDPSDHLRQMGVPEEGIRFLVQGKGGAYYGGRRVELNHLTADRFIDWQEKLLIAHGAHKVIPDRATIQGTYIRDVLLAVGERAAREAMERAAAVPIPIPPGLIDRVRGVEGTRESWDAEVWWSAREAVDVKTRNGS